MTAYEENFGQMQMRTDPTDLITNIPGVVGYYPDSHLILLTGGVDIDPHTKELTPFVGPLAVCRIADLTDYSFDIGSLAESLRDKGCSCVAMFFIDKRWGSAEHEEIARIALECADRLREEGIAIDQINGVCEIHEGEPITDTDHEIVGIVEKPTDSPAARRLFSAGECIADREDAVLNRFEPLATIATELKDQLQQIEKRARRDVSEPTALSLYGRDTRLSDFYRDWLDVIERLDSGELPLETVLFNPAYAQAIVRMHVNVILRDLMMAHLDGPLAVTMRELWLALQQHYRGEVRCNALACYAIDRINQGAKNTAKWALHASEQEDDQHSLTGLLQLAISAGIEDRCLETIKGAAMEVVQITHRHRE